MSFIKVAVPGPFKDGLTYSCSATHNAVIGTRVLVPLARRRVIGIVIATDITPDIDTSKIRSIYKCQDSAPIFNEALLKLSNWMSIYYHANPGDLFHTFMPGFLCQGKTIKPDTVTSFSLTALGQNFDISTIKNAKKQVLCLQFIKAQTKITQALLQEQGISKAILNNLQAKQLIVAIEDEVVANKILSKKEAALDLNQEQRQALDICKKSLNSFQVLLLQGVTGSGKTEVYLQLIQEVLDSGRQALVLVPEISLTPQLFKRLKNRFVSGVTTLHSALSEKQKALNYLLVTEGKANIVVGTRSSVFVPFKNLGVIIIDEEHDTSFKQQHGICYSAKDVAIMRAKFSNVPVVLGSATPSLESIQNATHGNYKHLQLLTRAIAAHKPKQHVIDIRQQKLTSGISKKLQEVMSQHLLEGRQVLLFINRRGYAPVFMCTECSWVARCNDCDAYYTVHHLPNEFLCCHHCAATREIPRACDRCHSHKLNKVGIATERVFDVLQQLFPNYKVALLDRSNVSSNKKLNAVLDSINSNESQIIIGTQMVTKGHHFANLSMVGVLDIDAGLFGMDFRSLERLGQLLTQVSGRAGREEHRGEIYLQTQHPNHPLLKLLLTEGYDGFAKQILQQRQLNNWPPFSYLVLLKSISVQQQDAIDYLDKLYDHLASLRLPGLQLLGPIPALITKKAGKYRYHLLLKGTDRKVLHKAILHLKTLSKYANRKVQLVVDVDPVDVV
ncbi:MAG: primosomal protein N' [Thiotrichales bacterium]|nr:MAG: primosomal protein N' [Thiotrichales bacterium]